MYNILWVRMLVVARWTTAWLIPFRLWSMELEPINTVSSSGCVRFFLKFRSLCTRVLVTDSIASQQSTRKLESSGSWLNLLKSSLPINEVNLICLQEWQWIRLGPLTKLRLSSALTFRCRPYAYAWQWKTWLFWLTNLIWTIRCWCCLWCKKRSLINYSHISRSQTSFSLAFCLLIHRFSFLLVRFFSVLLF